MRKVELLNITCIVCGNIRYFRPFELRQRSGLFCSKKCTAIYKNSLPEYRNKQKKIAKEKGYGKWMKGKKLSEETKLKIRISQIGHARKGWKLSEEICKRMGESRRGEKSSFWKGGVSSKATIIRSSADYKEWRKKVFSRDDYTCVLCGIRGAKIHADHIKPFALFPELRLDINNGRTLCVPCHKNTPTYLKSGKKLVEAQYGIEVTVL